MQSGLHPVFDTSTLGSEPTNHPAKPETALEFKQPPTLIISHALDNNMGLIDLVPGLGGDSDTAENETLTATRLFIVDPVPWKKESYNDFQLMIGPEPESDSDEWVVYRCTTATNIPSDTQLFVFEHGNIVSMGGNPFQLCLAQLVRSEDVDESYDGYYIDFPEELTEQTIPERSVYTEDELNMFYVSLADL
jgi:hypothetical protein